MSEIPSRIRQEIAERSERDQFVAWLADNYPTADFHELLQRARDGHVHGLLMLIAQWRKTVWDRYY